VHVQCHIMYGYMALLGTHINTSNTFTCTLAGRRAMSFDPLKRHSALFSYGGKIGARLSWMRRDLVLCNRCMLLLD
jgi:hypothetical protein